MRVLPVLDLLNGVTVHGIAGRRSTYRPVQSRLARGAEPLELVQAFRDQCQLTICYLADLDAILHGRPNLRLFERLRAQGFGLLIDAGVRRLADARAIMQAGANLVIVGLETSPGPDSLREIVDVRVAGGVVTAGACRNPAAQRGELKALRKVAQRQAVPSQLGFDVGAISPGLDTRGTAHRVDFQHLAETLHVQ